MGKGKRNRERRRREQQQPTAEMRITGSTKAVDLMRERMEQAAGLMAEIPTPEDLPPAIEKRIAAIEGLLAGYDALHFLANFTFANLPAHPDTYVESEEESSAAQVEVLSGILLRRDSREGASEHLLPIGGEIIDPVRDQLRDLLNLMTLEGFISAFKGANNREEAWVRAHGASQSLHLHAPGFHWQEKETIRALFCTDQIGAALRNTCGFDGDAALKCSEALELLLQSSFEKQRLATRKAADAARRGESNEAARWVEKTFTSQDLSNDQIAALILTAWTFHNWGDVLSWRPRDLAEKADVSEREASAFLDALALSFGEIDPRLRTATEQVRACPFIRSGEGVYQPSLPGNVLWAIRPLFESALKQAGGKVWERYQTHRSQWVEQRTADLLGGIMQPELLETDVRYTGRINDQEAKGEIDNLLRLGDTLLVIEAKAGTIGGRRGGHRLIDHLKKVLTKAAWQASVAKQALQEDQKVSLQASSGETLELGIERAREIHPIVVTLDDLSLVAPNLWELTGSPLLPKEITAPWVINLHELELICGLVEHPVQLVHFLRRRSRLNQLGGRVASDELDWWMLYLSTSLYFEEEGELLHQVRYASLTDPLDVYYFYEKGERSQEAPKPRWSLEAPMETFLEFLDEHRPPGFVAAACDLLDISGESREKFFTDITKMQPVAERRNRPQRGTYAFTENQAGGMILGFITVPDGEAPRLRDHLQRLAEERLSEHEAERFMALGREASSSRPFDALLVVEPTVWRLPASENDAPETVANAD